MNYLRFVCGYLFVAIPVLIGAGAGTDAAAASTLQVKARSIPAHCEFVYQVESDFIVNYHNEALAAGSQVTMIYGFEDAYGKDGQWLRETVRVLEEAEEPQQWRTSMTEESFSVSKSYLYREMNFYFEIRHPDGTTEREPAETQWFYHVSFGREFGDPCTSRPYTPYRERQITRKVLVE